MILGFCGYSNTGKTTMIEELVRALTGRGFKVGVVKHVPHDVDVNGKDSRRFRESGAEPVILMGTELVEFRDSPSLFSVVRALNSEVDAVLVEGFKKEKFIKKVCFGDAECENCVMHEPSGDEVLEYMLRELEIEKIERKLPNFNCGECGHKNCHEMAQAIYSGKDEFKNCRYWNPNAVISVTVNGKEIYMGRFAQDIMINTISGLLSSFKGVRSVEEVSIKFRVDK